MNIQNADQPSGTYSPDPAENAIISALMDKIEAEEGCNIGEKIDFQQILDDFDRRYAQSNEITDAAIQASGGDEDSFIDDLSSDTDDKNQYQADVDFAAILKKFGSSDQDIL